MRRNKRRGVPDPKLWEILGLIPRNWTALLCFEVLYRSIGFTVLFPFLRTLLGLLPGMVGQPYLGQRNILLVLRHPPALLLVLGVLLGAALFVFFEIAALFLYCESGWRRESLTVWRLFRLACGRVSSLLHPKRLPVFLLLPAMILSVFSIASGYLQNVILPEFLLEFFAQSPALLLGFAAAVLLAHLALFSYLYGFPLLLLERASFFSSWRGSLRLLRGRVLRTAGRLGAYFLFFLAALAALGGAAVLLLFARVKLFVPAAAAHGEFQVFFSSARLLWSAFSGALFSVSFCAAVVALYHHARGDARPQGAKPARTWRGMLRRGAAVAATFILATIFSESELSGQRWLSPGVRPEVIAHRAGAAFAPENTVAALKAAAEDGAAMAEIDVQQLKDGTLIVMHDTNFLRTAGVDLNVWDAEYDTVKQLDAGSFYSPRFQGEPVPTLARMLAAAKGKLRLMIELKTTGHEQDLVKKTVALIHQYGMERECVLASMDMKLLERVKAVDPALETAYISVLLLTDRYDLNAVDGYSVETTSLSPSLVAQAHFQNKKVYAWTANSEATLYKILYCHADGIVTDNPPLALFCIGEANEDRLASSLADLLFPQ